MLTIVMRAAALLSLLIVQAGCSDDATGRRDGPTGPADGPRADAVEGSGCWPLVSEPRGAVTLGTGEHEFQVMPDEVPLVFGIQEGFHIVVHARMSGLSPGNIANLIDPANPYTRFSAFFADSGEPITTTFASPCGLRVPYKPTSDDASTYQLRMGSATLFETTYGPDDLFGTRVRVVVEIIDEGLGYARDEKIVTCLQPVIWTGPDAAPRSDAGPAADAGP